MLAKHGMWIDGGHGRLGTRRRCDPCRGFQLFSLVSDGPVPIFDCLLRCITNAPVSTMRTSCITSSQALGHAARTRRSRPDQQVRFHGTDAAVNILYHERLCLVYPYFPDQMLNASSLEGAKAIW